MPSFYKRNIPIIDDDRASEGHAFPGFVRYGYTGRDYSQSPIEMFDPPSSMGLIDQSEWDARYDEQESQQSSLEHIYLGGGAQPRFVNLDQNGNGYCWAYSTGHALMMSRLASNQPLVRLNPHGPAAIIKRGRDEGGWCGLSAQFARENGYPEEGDGEGQWPLHARDLRRDTPTLRAAMARHKTTEEWCDLSRPVHAQNLTQLQLPTALFLNFPCPTDFMWWLHSVCSIRWVRVEKGSWGILILNSWKGWGRFGLAVLRGSKAVWDGALAVRSSTPSPV